MKDNKVEIFEKNSLGNFNPFCKLTFELDLD